MEILTILIIFIAWFFELVIAPMSKLSYDDELNKSEKKRGISVSPFLLVFPLTAIALMYVINYFNDPIGTYIFLSVHGFLLLSSIASATYWDLKRTNKIGSFGFWIFYVFNILICLAIIAAIPYITWRLGAHWAFVVLSSVIALFASGFLAVRVLFRLTWSDRMFGEVKERPGKRVSLKKMARQAYVRRKQQEVARESLKRFHEKEEAERAHEEFLKEEAARRSGSRWIDYKDFSSEIDMAELMIGKDLDKKEFTVDDGVPGSMKKNFMYEFLSKRTTIYHLWKYHIDESGIRITPEDGPEEFYAYADIEAIDMAYYEVDSGIMGEGRWERPLPIYKANLLFITAGGKRQEIPYNRSDGAYHNFLPPNVAWFIIRQYNKVKEKEYRETLKASGEIPIGWEKTGEVVHMNSKGFRCGSRFLPLEEVWWATIWENGTVTITDNKGNDLPIILDYALPEAYLALHFIRAMIIPKRIPIQDRKLLPGALNRIKTRKNTAVFAVISFVCFVISGYFANYGITANNWKETGGVVLSSRALHAGGDTPGWSYVVVSYRYDVDGVNYVNDRFKYGGKIFAYMPTASRFAEQFPEGGEISVYYNPKNAEQAVLEPGVGFFFYVTLVLALFCLLTALVYHVVIYRKAEELRKRYR
jgi:hypothetical protein